MEPFELVSLATDSSSLETSDDETSGSVSSGFKSFCPIENDDNEIRLDLANKYEEIEAIEQELKKIEIEALKHQKSISEEQHRFIGQMMRIEKTEKVVNKPVKIRLRPKKKVIDNDPPPMDGINSFFNYEDIDYTEPVTTKDPFLQKAKVQKLIFGGIALGFSSLLWYKYGPSLRRKRTYSIQYKL